jgi:cytochrome c556
MKSWSLAASAVIALLACGQAAAQFKNPDDAIEYRQGALAVMGNHFSRIGAMASGKVPFDARAVQANADLVATLAKLPWSAFIEGSDKGDTNARPEVWSQADKFKAASQKLEDATVKLAAAAKTGNQDAIKAAFGTTGETCKACHDDFRKKH